MNFLNFPMPKGGARPNSGPKKGSQHAATISAHEEKQITRSVIREHIRSHIPAIIAAQVDNAKGVPYLILRDPATGAYVRATDEKQVDEALARYNAGDESALKFFTKEPHQGSASMLLAYAADKPVEPVEHSGEGGGPVVFRWQK